MLPNRHHENFSNFANYIVLIYVIMVIALLVIMKPNVQYVHLKLENSTLSSRLPTSGLAPDLD